jgi:hypothetical protein
VGVTRSRPEVVSPTLWSTTAQRLSAPPPVPEDAVQEVEETDREVVSPRSAFVADSTPSDAEGSR